MRLIPYAAEHVAAIQAYLDDPDVRAFTPVPEPVPHDHAQAYLTRFDAGRADGTSAAWAIVDDDGSVLGFACAPHLSKATGDVELGYSVGPQARGRGVATWVLRELTGWAFGWGAERVELRINADNVASRRIADRCGYTMEGILRSGYLKVGRRVDTTVWSRLPTDPKVVEDDGAGAYVLG